MSNEKRKQEYYDLKSKGLCVQCRKKAEEGRVRCKKCASYQNERNWIYKCGANIKKNKIKKEGSHVLKFNNKTTDTLKGIYEEVTKYNEEHGTNYSYGYYSALKFRGLI